MMCCMKGEKVSTPSDKDGRGSCPDSMHTVKALPPTSWHRINIFAQKFIGEVEKIKWEVTRGRKTMRDS